MFQQKYHYSLHKINIIKKKNIDSSQSENNANNSFVIPSQSVNIQKPMFANVDTTINSAPVLIVHPSQKSFAVHKLKAIVALNDSTTNFTTQTTLPTMNVASEINTFTNEKQNTQSECSTLNNALIRVSRYNDNSRESRTKQTFFTQGLLDISQGSGDRLQKWKSKLLTGRRHKDTSEPPPSVRNTITSHHISGGHSSDAEVILDWRPTSFIPLQPSASELITSNNKSLLSSTLIQPRMLQTARSTIDIMHSDGVSLTDSQMERHTTMQCDENKAKYSSNLTMHFQNIENLQHLMHAIEGDESVTMKNTLPPPVRITPFSGMKPQDSDIIRPVAFRPCAIKQTQMLTPLFTSTKNDMNPSNIHHSNMNTLKKTSKTSDKMCLISTITHPHTVYQPSTSIESSSSSTSTSLCKQQQCTSKIIEENDYDVVPEYIDREHMLVHGGENQNCSMLYQNQTSLQIGSSHMAQRDAFMQHLNNNNNSYPFNTNNQYTTSPKKSYSSHHFCGSNISNGSRNSSGIHVTPSPSDSGIVDYESIIRDKENELASVRNTMEQNEEIIIRVYQEKERIWKEQLIDLKQKLLASQQGESALRQQIQRCNEQREQFQAIINNLSSDKQELQRKCIQIEHEMLQIRDRFNELMHSHDHNTYKRFSSRTQSDHSKNIETDHNVQSQPLLTLTQKETYCTDASLRMEVEQLREEISTLRDALNEQIELFADEKKRWEIERNQMIKYNHHHPHQSATTSDGCSSIAFNSRGISNGKASTECIISDHKLI